MEPASPARNPRLTWLVYAALAAALGAYAVKVVLRHNIDFRCYWDVGQYALHHLNIYMPSGVGYYVFYLPYFALLMVPWALLPYLWGGALWFALKVWMVTAMHRTHAAAVGLWAQPRTPTLLLTWLPLLVLLNCWNNDFKLGQVNVLIHFFLWRCLLDAQRGHTTRAGLFFVLAMVKVTPWVFVPYFVVTRQWRLLRSIVGWSLVAALALVVWFGPSEATALPQRWLEVSQREKLGVVGSANIENQSIHGVVARALAHVEVEGPRDYVFTSTPEDEARFKPITYAWCLAVFLWALWMIARHGGGRQIRLEDAALMMVVMLLVSPDTRLFHMVHLYVPLQVLALGLAQPINDAASRLARAAFVTIGLTFVLTSRDLIGPVWHSILRYHGHQAITLWVITAALAWLVRRKPVPA